MKAFVSLLLAICLLLPLTVAATAAETPELRFEVTADGSATVLGCDDSSVTALTIPDTLGGAPVTAIAAGAFADCSALAEIEIPQTVTFIGYGAFAGTPWLVGLNDEFAVVGGGVLLRYNGTATDVVIPEGVVCITEAFAGSAITSVSFPQSLVTIGDHAFDGCKKLAGDLMLFEGLQSIGDYAFNRCQKLIMVLFPNSLRRIGDYAFYYCPKLEGAKMPLRLESVGKYAFYSCGGVMNITLPESCTSVGEYAFASMGSVLVINLPNSMTEIPAHAFDNVYFAGNVYLPTRLTSIGEYAFTGLQSLDELRLPGTLISIGAHAFEKCGLMKLSLPASVETIGDSAFVSCDDLTEVSFPADSRLQSVGALAFSYTPLLGKLVLPASLTSLGKQSMTDGASLCFRGTEAAFTALLNGDGWADNLTLTYSYAD